MRTVLGLYVSLFKLVFLLLAGLVTDVLRKSGAARVWAAVFLIFVLLPIWMWLQGVFMVFHASILLGILAFFFQVPFIAETLIYWVFGYDLAWHIAHALAMP